MALWIIAGALIGGVTLMGGGALIGGVVGWLIWKVVSMDNTIKALNERLQQLSLLLSQSNVSEQSKNSDIEASFQEKETPANASAPISELDYEDDSYLSEFIRPETTAPWPPIQPETQSQWTGARENHHKAANRFFELSNKVLAWFFSGNMLVRIGSIILFFGAGFLLKYTAEHSQLSIEMRMWGIALTACIMLGVGWLLRTSRPIYGLALQGGGLGLLYLTIFASFRLYDLLPASQALTMLALVSGAGVGMAVIYNARWLAILAFAGGFLAPILASTGSGSHVALFSWYAVLNVGIALLAWHKAWRSLNLLGMVATFIVTALWGYNYYQTSFFDSVEPFLIGFGLLYLAIGVLFSLHQADPKQENFGRVDASIIFGTPIGFFLLQTPLVHEFEHGMSLSALLSGMVYLMPAWLAFKLENRVLALSLLSIAVTLLTLAIPLEFDEAETAAAWAMEGVGLLWLGIRQNSQRALLTGLLLQLLAAICWWSGSPLMPSASYGSSLSALLIAFSAWTCVLLLDNNDWRADRPDLSKWMPKNIAFVFQCLGLIWWLTAGMTELNRHFNDHDLLLSAILLITCSALLVEGLGLRLGWQAFRRLNVGLIWLLLAALVKQFDYVAHPFEAWGALVWLSAIVTAFWMLYRDDKKSEQVEYDSAAISKYNLFHVAWVCFLLLFLIRELHWQLSTLLSTPMHMPIWADLTAGIVAALLLMILSSNVKRWPVAAHRTSYLQVSAVICLLVLAGWLSWTLFNPVNISVLYIPLFNPLDIVIFLVALAVFVWWRALKQYELVFFKEKYFYLLAGLVGFIVFNADIVRISHHWFATAWSIQSMQHSVEFQAGLSLSWSLLALILMSWASRQGGRTLWMTGATLLALVVLKLFIIDLSGTGTMARIVSFLGVGGLLLLIGYMSPVPPNSAESDDSVKIDEGSVD